MPRFTVVGTQPVLDHQPGETFTATFPEEQEKFLIGIGALKRLGDKPASPDPKPSVFKRR